MGWCPAIRAPTRTRHGPLRLQCWLPSVLPVLEEAMVAHEAAVVLHAREQGVRGQHASSVRAFSECRPCALMRVFHDDDCLGVFLVCLRILVGRQSVTLKAKLLDVV